MSKKDAITILHLSDLQFGRNHRFGRLHLPPPDDTFDSLFSHLRDDLDLLKNSHSLRPSLIIVTGDMTEIGMAKEFADARELLERLAEYLGLKHNRVALIPGNHDVNRKACEAYFNECEANDEKPLPPFTPKWKHYGAMFEEFYKDYSSIRFTIEEPWTLFEVPELKVVVAGLNSTMSECHDIRLDDRHPWHEEYVRSGKFGHFGWCGESQLRFFVEYLEKFKAKGWLRIAAVHHNYRRGATDDSDNLRDANDLEKFLGDAINLLLHGHTHEGKLDRMPGGVPILSTGSAALQADARPEEVPNQYQIIRLHAAGIERFTRCFDPRQKQWIADVRSSKKKDRWHTNERLQFVNVHATFPRGSTRTQTHEARTNNVIEENTHSEIDAGAVSIRDDFFTRVAEVCRHRRPAAEVTPIILDKLGIQYLRVVEKHEGFVKQYPVAVFPGSVTKSDMESFVANVHAKYRATDPALTSEIIYGGIELPSLEVTKHAERLRVRLLSFLEYQGIIDFRAYLHKQNARLETDTIYPPSLYVAQRMRFGLGADRGKTNDALKQISDWLVSPNGRFVLILGDPGTGKTFLLRELARRLGKDRSGLTPMVIELRGLEKAQRIETLVAQHLATAGMERIDLPAFRYMVQQGRIVLLFDGFDELALRITYDRAAEHFDTIVQAADGCAKIVVTSRTQHFESEKQVRTVLYERTQPLPGLRYCRLFPFSETQVRLFLHNRWGDEKEAEQWYELLRDVKDLLGLSKNPRMLGFIVELDKKDIILAKRREGVISAADLYRLLLERWLIHEYDRANPPGSQTMLSRKARWAAVTAIALRLWQKTENSLTRAEVTQEAAAIIAQEKNAPPPTDIATHLICSGSLLRRDEEGCFFFVHPSVMEWLVAHEAAQQIKLNRESSLLSTRPLSMLMAEFLCDLLGRDIALAWAGDTVAREVVGTSALKSNAMDVLKRLEAQVVLNLAGEDLRGKSFSGQYMVGANLSRADLTEASLIGKNLTNAKLDNAKLIRADLTKATLTDASLTKADLSEARLLGADLRGANLCDTQLRRAKLVGAKLDAMQWHAERVFGAAMPSVKQAAPNSLSTLSACSCVAWNPHGDLLASAHDDGTVCLWEAVTGMELRALLGHQKPVRSVAFSPDGRWLASASDDCTIRLWDVATGLQVHSFVGHLSAIVSVVFSPNGCWLASSSADYTVRLWDAPTGGESRKFTGHRSTINSVAFNPNSGWLAAGGNDNTLRLWETTTGKEVRRFAGHRGAVTSVVFSPDGRWLASGSDDQTIRIWEVSNARRFRQFNGHRYGVRSLSFSPNGRWLASSDGKTACLWDVGNGKELRGFTGPRETTRTLSFNPSGSWLASGSDDGEVRLWDASSGKELRLFTRRQAAITCVTFSPDGRHLATGTTEKVLRLWDVATARRLREYVGHQDTITSAAFSANARWLASSSSDRTIRLWETASDTEALRFTGRRYNVTSISFSPDGRWIASGSADNTVRLWEATTGRELRRFDRHHNTVTCVAFSPDGRYIASGSADNTIRLSEAVSGREYSRLVGHRGGVTSVAFSPNGRWLASGSSDRTVRLWGCASAIEIGRLTQHQSTITSVAFRPDGRWLAAASPDKTILLWEIRDLRFKNMRTLIGHQRTVRSISFSPNGQWLASASDDNTVRLWRFKTGKWVVAMIATPEGWVAFTPDGRYKLEGNLAGHFWHTIGLCRFEAGELDDYIPGIRMPLGEPVLRI